MKIKYLGTAAYEGVPSLFCHCAVCREARGLRGRYIRSRSQALINGELLLDFPPDMAWHSNQYGLDWAKIGDCLVTHSHSDHLYPEDVEMAGTDYSGEHRTMRFYVGRDGYERLYEIVKKPPVQKNVKLNLIEPGKSCLAGDKMQYKILPLRANHDPSTSPVIYSITQGGKSILYAHDTGIFPAETWKMLEGEKRFDLVSLDCTGGIGNYGEWREGHMSLKVNREIVGRMRHKGFVDGNTVIIMSHFSHNSGDGYGKMAIETEKYGFLTAYDGMEIEI